MSEHLHDTPPTRREIRTVFAGLMLALALASLDQNIVGIALPAIVSDLGGLSHLSWVVTAFLVTSTATTPLYGKLSDLYGRKPLFIIAIVVFLAGSCLCGLSRTMTQLIVFRAIQGLGAGGLITLAQTTIADIVAPRERGRYQGLFGAVFGFSSIAGPLVGGFITDALSWHWIFYINLPVGILALALIVFGFHRPHHAVSHKIDYAGAFLMTSATVALLLLLTGGGVQHSRTSPIIACLAGAAVTLIILLIVAEQRATEPLLSPHLFRNNVFLISTGVMGLTFMGLFSATLFLPLYFQLILHLPPAKTGLMMAPMTGGMIMSSVISGRMVSMTGKYKRHPVAGLAAAMIAFGTLSLSAATGSGGFLLVEAAMVFLGCGVGLVMPNLVVALQNAVGGKEQGAATAAGAYFRSLGGTFGAAISGALMSWSLHSAQQESWFGKALSLSEQGINRIAELPAGQQEAVIGAYRHAIALTFLAGTVITGFAFLLALALPEKPLKTYHDARQPGNLRQSG